MPSCKNTQVTPSEYLYAEWPSIWPAVRGAAWQRFAVPRTIALSQGLQSRLLVLATDRQSVVSEGSDWMCRSRMYFCYYTVYWLLTNVKLLVQSAIKACPPVQQKEFPLCAHLSSGNQSIDDKITLHISLVLWWKTENNFLNLRSFGIKLARSARLGKMESWAVLISHCDKTLVNWCNQIFAFKIDRIQASNI